MAGVCPAWRLQPGGGGGGGRGAQGLLLHPLQAAAARPPLRRLPDCRRCSAGVQVARRQRELQVNQSTKQTKPVLAAT